MKHFILTKQLLLFFLITITALGICQPQAAFVEESYFARALPLYVAADSQVRYDPDFKLIPVIELAKNHPALTKSRDNILVFSREINGLPLSVSTDRRSIAFFFIDLAKALRAWYRKPDRIPAHYNARTCAGYCIAAYGLKPLRDNSEAAFFETFNEQVRLHMLQDYDLYLHEGYIDLISSFPEYENHIKQLSIYRSRFSTYLNNTLELGNKKHDAILDKVIKLHGQIIKRENQIRQEREAARLAHAEHTRTSAQVHQELVQREHQLQTAIEKNPQAPSYLKEQSAAITTFLSGNDTATQRVEFGLDEESARLLSESHVPIELFSVCIGNKLQASLHQGFVELLKQATTLEHKGLQTMVTEGTIIGQELNRNGHIGKAYDVFDFCHALLNFSKGFTKGAWQSVANVGYSICHPIETSKNIASNFKQVIAKTIRITRAYFQWRSELEEITELMRRNHAEGFKRLQPFTEKNTIIYNKIHNGLKRRANAVASLSSEQWGEAAGRLVTDAYLCNRLGGYTRRFTQNLKTNFTSAIQQLEKGSPARDLALVTAEGIEVKIAGGLAEEGIHLNRTTNHAVKNITENIEWTAHGHKHLPPKNVSWKEIVAYTKHGKAKYIPDINIEQLERMAWEKGIPTTNGKPWKVMKCDKIIGAKSGLETQYIRVEMSAKTIHGHPITPSEFKDLTK